MSDETKTKALDKLSKFTVKVGYPDEWKDYSKLQVLSKNEGGTLYGNLKNVADWAYQKELDKVGKKVDKKEWGMTPQTVNAYYNPVNNEIVFPAAILQAPFFDFKADPAVNFGGIGAVIGHEISHGFDDSGAMFDGDGNLKNWWTDADKKNFEEATKKLAEQYSKYEPVKGTFVNGLFTNGENIADLGGVALRYCSRTGEYLHLRPAPSPPDYQQPAVQCSEVYGRGEHNDDGALRGTPAGGGHCRYGQRYGTGGQGADFPGVYPPSRCAGQRGLRTRFVYCAHACAVAGRND
jgi:hypothetical protein